MEEKQKLLAKTLMDASKIMFVSVFGSYLINQYQINWPIFMLELACVFLLGYMAWMIHPTKIKGEANDS